MILIGSNYDQLEVEFKTMKGYLIGCLILLTRVSPVSGLCSTCQQERCYDNGECIVGCVPGYFGQYCDEACPPGCLNKACHFDLNDGTVTCTEGCIPGYCDIQCDLPCPGDCLTCNRQCDSCNVTLCPKRRYGADCSEICSPRYGKCDRETGQCIICRRGFYGDECRQDCPKCFTRADTIRDTCLSGCHMCQSEETCPVGFHGDACEVQCSPGCDKPERGCNRATEECSIGCVFGYHGQTCNYTCSEHCLSGRCDRVTGDCSTRCVSGYYGLTCNYTCRRFCVGGVCNQHDGVCTSGCINGYRPYKDVCEQLSSEGSNKAVAIAVPIILVCLVAVMVIAAFIWRRRRYRRSNTAETGSVEDCPDTVQMLSQEASQIQALAYPAIFLNSQKVHGRLQVEKCGRKLTNMARSGKSNTPGQFEKFWGTCSSLFPLPPSPSPSYWETQCTLLWSKGVGFPLLEMGVKEGESNMDERNCVSLLPGGVCVSVRDYCRLHPDQLCIQVWRRDQEEETGHQVCECVSLPLPTSGEEVIFTFGLVLDVGRGRVALLDVGRGKLFCKLDLNFTQQVFPMFYVNPFKTNCATRMGLICGSEISVTDQKKDLIQQALSD